MYASTYIYIYIYIYVLTSTDRMLGYTDRQIDIQELGMYRDRCTYTGTQETPPRGASLRAPPAWPRGDDDDDYYHYYYCYCHY